MLGHEDYWLEVCDGREAALTYIRASDDDGVIAALDQYPILMLPEFPAAIAVMGASTDDPDFADACAENARALRYAQQALRTQLTAAHGTQLTAAYGHLMMNLALVLEGEQRGDRRRNLEHAIAAFRAAGEAYGTGFAHATMLADEGTSRWQLAELGVDPEGNLERAAALYGEARAGFGPGEHAGQCAVNEAKARVTLAERGVDAIANLRTATELYVTAFRQFDREDHRAVACVVGLAHARTRLDELGETGAGGS
jgi:hypothetical protein